MSFSLFVNGYHELYNQTFAVNFYFHIFILILFGYVYSRLFFVIYEINENSLIIRHPLGKRRYFFKDFSYLNEEIPFSLPFNLLRIFLKNGKQVNILFINNYVEFLQQLKGKLFNQP